MSTARTAHDMFCKDDKHSDEEDQAKLEACYGCEQIFTCREVLVTYDSMYPVVCRDCW